MKRTILIGILAAAAGCGALMAQQSKAQTGTQGAAPGAAAQPSGPRPKSNEEVKAVNAMIQAQAQGPDAVLKAADDLLTRFSDTEFKGIALSLEADAYQRKGDFAKAEIAYQDALKLNPKDFQAELQLGALIVSHTGENDLNKDQELTQADTLLRKAITDVKEAAKPNPQLTDEKWASIQKQEVADATSNLAKAALLRKNYDEAINQYKSAQEMDPQPAYQAYLAMAYQKAGKNDESLDLCNKLLADPQLNPAVKNYVTNVQKMATAAKGTAAPK
jgi:tetratricopeptide (TPR) repeat protein